MKKKLLLIGMLLVFAFAATGCMSHSWNVTIDENGNGNAIMTNGCAQAVLAQEGIAKEEIFDTYSHEQERIDSYKVDSIEFEERKINGELYEEIAFKYGFQGLEEAYQIGNNISGLRNIFGGVQVEKIGKTYFLIIKSVIWDDETVYRSLWEFDSADYNGESAEDLLKFSCSMKVDGTLISSNAKKIEKDGTLVWEGFDPIQAKWEISEKQAKTLLKSNFPLTDVPGHWAEDALRYMYEMGVMEGKSETLMKPDDTIKRAEAVAMIQRYFEYEGEVYPAVPFTDVAKDSWYYDTICWAYDTKVVNGISQTKFEPEKQLTMQELLKMLYNYFKAEEMLDWVGTDEYVAFSDLADVSDWAEEAIKFAGERGLLLIDEDGKCNPQAPATRAQFAEILYRVW